MAAKIDWHRYGTKLGTLKTQVRNSAFRKDGKRMYGKRKYNANLQSDKKRFGTPQVSVVHFQVGWASGLQTVAVLGMG